MVWEAKNSLAIAEIVIYSLFIPVAVYTWKKHGRPSLYGHVYLFIFLILRITADALMIAHRNDTAISNTPTIINSVGLSPLLLATGAFICQAAKYHSAIERTPERRRWLTVAEILFHAQVIAGVVLLVVGSLHSIDAQSKHDLESAETKADAGAALLLLTWTLLCIAAIIAFVKSKQDVSGGRQLPRLLLTEILVSLPFLGVRVLYSAVYIFDRSSQVDPTRISFVGYFFLVFLSQFICASVLVVGLLVTRNIGTEQHGNVSLPDYGLVDTGAQDISRHGK